MLQKNIMQKNKVKNSKKALKIFLANPRGFCAGVERAIAIVDKALEKYGPPIYVKHEIVHNKFVVDNLKKKGVIFVENIAEIPVDAISIYSAHGVSKQVEDQSLQRNLQIFDATCPLVKKVHNQVVKYEQEQKDIIMIGHAGHPEVVGTSGRVEQKIYLVENIKDAKNLSVSNPDNLIYITQTTLSVTDTKDIIAVLKQRFPNIIAPSKDDICYATQNRQDAVKEMINDIEMLLVIGAKNSSNSNRLCDIAKNHNIPGYLIDDFRQINLDWFNNINVIGITAGASAPEILVTELLNFLEKHFLLDLIKKDGKTENIIFNIPKSLRG